MVSEIKMNQEKLKMLQAQVRIGGKGTVRRKKKVVHRTATTDDKKLQSSLKKLSGIVDLELSDIFSKSIIFDTHALVNVKQKYIKHVSGCGGCSS